jgi:hypothetical protein
MLVTNPDRTNTSIQEIATSQKYVEHILSICTANAGSIIKKFVLTGAWRNGVFALEPGYVYARYMPSIC